MNRFASSLRPLPLSVPVSTFDERGRPARRCGELPATPPPEAPPRGPAEPPELPEPDGLPPKIHDPDPHQSPLVQDPPPQQPHQRHAGMRPKGARPAWLH